MFSLTTADFAWGCFGQPLVADLPHAALHWLPYIRLGFPMLLLLQGPVGNTWLLVSNDTLRSGGTMACAVPCMMQ